MINNFQDLKQAVVKEGGFHEVTEELYDDALGAVPPIWLPENGFLMGESYSGNFYYAFFTKDGKFYGSLCNKNYAIKYIQDFQPETNMNENKQTIIKEAKFPEIKKEYDTKYSQLMKDCQIFFAFSDKQWEENKVPLEEGDKYVSIGAGGYMPKSKVEQFINGSKQLKKWYNSAIKQSKSGEQEILDTLQNQEAFYTYELEDTFNALGGKYTMDQIQSVFNKNKHLYNESKNKNNMNNKINETTNIIYNDIVKEVKKTGKTLTEAQIKKLVLKRLDENQIVLKENYYTDQIDYILEPETEYGYKIQITNSGVPNGQPHDRTKWFSITKPQLIALKDILNGINEGGLEEGKTFKKNAGYDKKDKFEKRDKERQVKQKMNEADESLLTEFVNLIKEHQNYLPIGNDITVGELIDKTKIKEFGKFDGIFLVSNDGKSIKVKRAESADGLLTNEGKTIRGKEKEDFKKKQKERESVRKVKQGKLNESVKQDLINLGMDENDIDNHESDLYVKKNNISDSFLQNYEFKNNVTSFRNQNDGTIWYDFPFAYADEHFKLKHGNIE